MRSVDIRLRERGRELKQGRERQKKKGEGDLETGNENGEGSRKRNCEDKETKSVLERCQEVLGRRTSLLSTTRTY